MVNRRSVVFHKDSARPHTSVMTSQNLWKQGWEVLMHPSYSPDLAPRHHHLFLTLQYFLSQKEIGSIEECETHLIEVFANKRQYFYEIGIMKLPLKLQRNHTENWCIFDPNRTIGKIDIHRRAKIKDEVEKLAYQLNEEAERTERPIRRLSKVMYGSTCADMLGDVNGGVSE
ncbi:transposase [Trichonephila clavipes]|uniref:Transposase n=1 Tax=Trichonephila clavipes TaxID=2585209 RepID=A0A8X6RS91_TRICX|nr:transposase [Trichonephila clavipes]